LKKLIIMVVGLMILGGGAVSVMKWMKLGPFEEVAVEGQEEQMVRDDDTLFVDMEPLVIPVYQGDKVAATVQIQVKLETIGSENKAKLQHIMPKISDLFIRDLHTLIPHLLKQEEQIDVLIIKQRLKLISDKLIGPDLIQNVLGQSVIDTPAS
jgi:flagellar FliL protein